MLALYYASLTVSSKPVPSPLIIIIGLYFIYLKKNQSSQVLADFRASFTAGATLEGPGSKSDRYWTFYVPTVRAHLLHCSPLS